MTAVTMGSIWTSSNGAFYRVTAVARTGEESWVVYTKIGDPISSYTCLEPAFLQRFRQHTNESY